MSSPAYDGNQGGAGGKFRKRPFRKSHTTPYDRPPTALRPPQNLNDNNSNGNGWLSKIVDPASKLITAGAHKLFASVFRKRLLPPPSPSPSPPPPQRMEVEVKETEYLQQQMGKNVVTSDTKVPADSRVNNGYLASDSNGVGELEYMLNQKTFTRSEIDHLTALLLSRTVENSDDVDKGRSEPKPSDVQADHSRCDKLSYLPAYETRIDRAQFSTISTPEVRSKVLSDDVASPAEIAKAYMGSRPTNLSPSVVRLQNHLPKEELSTPSNCLKPVMSPTQKSVSNVGTSSNVFTTPRFRGRSAIYSMARTPCSRIYSATSNKPADTQFTTGGSSYLDATENNCSSKKQVLKRRSSVLENDIGSVGPIRRIRQKPNLLHPKTLSLPPPGVRRAMRVSEVPSSMEQSSQNRAFLKMHAENSTPSTSSGYVSSQSIEMAEKILEHLDKYSPKGNVGNKAGTSGGILPTKTPAKTTQDSLKPLQSSQDTKKVIGSKETVDAHNHQLQTSSMMEDVGATKAVSTSASFGPQDGTEGKKADSYLSSKGKAGEYMMPVPVNSHPQKQAFQMSAHEDFLELDDDLPSNDVALSTPLTEKTLNDESQKKPVSIPAILPQDQAVVVERHVTAETSSPPPPAGKSQLEALPNGSFVSDKSASSPFPVSLSPPASNTTAPGAIAPPLLPETDKVASQNEASGLFTEPCCKSDNLPSFVFTPPSAAKDSKLETPFSAKRTAAEANGSVNTENSKGTPVFSTTPFKFQDAPSVGDLPNGLKTNNATPVNGVLSAVPSKANESSIAASVSPSTPEAPFKFSDVKPSTSTITAPLPTFGSAFSSPSPTTTVATSSDTADKSGAQLTANEGISPFVSKSSTTGPTTTNAFLFQAAKPSVSASAPIFSSQSASSGSASVLTSASIFSAPASTSASLFPGLSAPTVSDPALTSTSTFTSSSLGSTLSPDLSFPSQSAASPSTFVFGSSGSTGPNSGSIFGSSTANPFSSGSGSATTSNGLGMGSSSTSTTTSTIFGYTGEPPKTTPSFGIGSFGATGNSLFGANTNTTSSSASNTSTFVFGGNSTPAAPTPAMTNSPFQSQPAFGSTSTQPFQFGSTPSQNNVQSTMEDTMAEDSSQPSTPPPIFGSPAPAFGAAPSPFGTPAPVFGATPQAPIFGATPPASGGSFGFNATTPAAANPFQFNTQQPSQNPVQNSSFQASGSLEFNGGANGGSFSLGTIGTGDKSQRRIVRVKKTGKRR